MPLGVKQSNSLLYISLDVWQDRVFYNEKDYPAGYFAASILNFQRDDLPQLAERGGTFGNLFPGVITADDDSEANELLPELRTKLSELAELLWKYPPFSLNDMDGERHLNQVMLSEKSLADLRNPLSRVWDFYPRYCRAMAVAPLAIYHFCIAGWFFELDYLRRLGKRDETYFAVAAHDCFSSERFWKALHELGRMDIEPFSVEPRMESTYVFARNPKNEKKLVFVNRLRFESLLDFYVFDLLNGLHHGHAPSQCRNCGKYFLTTTGHTPKYCDGIAPQDPQLTCRQYGAKHGDKESNTNHPIYIRFSTRANTIRKHAERGKIDQALRDEALKVATELREKAFMDSKYAADGYTRDMELDAIYSQGQRALGDRGVMTTEMYYVGGADLSNEELAAQVRNGDNDAAALLLSRNEGFLSTEAAKLCEQYSLPDIADDLKQEGALALLAAARRYDPSNGAKLLTYAVGAVRTAMLDYIAQCSLPVRLPPSRYHQLRRVSYLCTSSPEGLSDAELIDLIGGEMKAFPRVTATLLTEYRTLFGSVFLGDEVFSVSRGGDPAKRYDAYMRKKLLIKLMAAALTPRELNVVRYHLGLDRPGGQKMTFAELAVRLNYSDSSAAEKLFRRAVKKLREHLYAGEYGAWAAAGRAIDEAKREAQKY